MLETLKFSKTLKSSWEDFNVLDNFNVSSIKTAIEAALNNVPLWGFVTEFANTKVAYLPWAILRYAVKKEETPIKILLLFKPIKSFFTNNLS